MRGHRKGGRLDLVKEIFNIFKKWRFEIFHQAEVSTFTMSIGHVPQFSNLNPLPLRGGMNIN